jgi:hypothetical protein
MILSGKPTGSRVSKRYIPSANGTTFGLTRLTNEDDSNMKKILSIDIHN